MNLLKAVFENTIFMYYYSIAYLFAYVEKYVRKIKLNRQLIIYT